MGFQDFKGTMRPQNKRSRGRGHNPNNPNNPNRPRGPHRQQTFDSNGPGVKIRGNAYQVFERYIALAREAASSGDRIAAENLYQHAEHYYRIMNANGEGFGQAPRPTTPADIEMAMGEPDQGQQGGYQGGSESQQDRQHHPQDRADRQDAPERQARQDRPERPDRPERGDRQDRPERQERQERADRPDRPERQDRRQPPPQQGFGEQPPGFLDTPRSSGHSEQGSEPPHDPGSEPQPY